MYCVMNDDGNIIAYHEDKEVVQTYIENLLKSNDNEELNLSLVKIKNKIIEKNRRLDDLYLVRYGSTYIQTGYLIYLQIVSDDIANENIYIKDLLLRTLEVYKLSDKEAKTLTKAVKVIEKIIKRENCYTPTIEELNRYKMLYEEYQQKF